MPGSDPTGCIGLVVEQLRCAEVSLEVRQIEVVQIVTDIPSWLGDEAENQPNFPKRLKSRGGH
jgi:hypothetical protein